MREERSHKRFILVHQSRLLPIPTLRVRLSTIISSYLKILSSTILLITPDQSDYTLYYQPQQACTILDHTRKVGTTLSQTIKPNRLET